MPTLCGATGGRERVLRIVFVRERERESSLSETFARTMAGSFVTSRANFCRSLFIKNVTRGAGTVVARRPRRPGSSPVVAVRGWSSTRERAHARCCERWADRSGAAAPARWWAAPPQESVDQPAAAASRSALSTFGAFPRAGFTWSWIWSRGLMCLSEALL